MAIIKRVEIDTSNAIKNLRALRTEADKLNQVLGTTEAMLNNDARGADRFNLSLKRVDQAIGDFNKLLIAAAQAGKIDTLSHLNEQLALVERRINRLTRDIRAVSEQTKPMGLPREREPNAEMLKSVGGQIIGTMHQIVKKLEPLINREFPRVTTVRDLPTRETYTTRAFERLARATEQQNVNTNALSQTIRGVRQNIIEAIRSTGLSTLTPALRDTIQSFIRLERSAKSPLSTNQEVMGLTHALTQLTTQANRAASEVAGYTTPGIRNYQHSSLRYTDVLTGLPQVIQTSVANLVDKLAPIIQARLAVTVPARNIPPTQTIPTSVTAELARQSLLAEGTKTALQQAAVLTRMLQPWTPREAAYFTATNNMQGRIAQGISAGDRLTPAYTYLAQQREGERALMAAHAGDYKLGGQRGVLIKASQDLGEIAEFNQYLSDLRAQIEKGYGAVGYGRINPGAMDVRDTRKEIAIPQGRRFNKYRNIHPLAHAFLDLYYQNSPDAMQQALREYITAGTEPTTLRLTKPTERRPRLTMRDEVRNWLTSATANSTSGELIGTSENLGQSLTGLRKIFKDTTGLQQQDVFRFFADPNTPLKALTSKTQHGFTDTFKGVIARLKSLLTSETGAFGLPKDVMAEEQRQAELKLRAQEDIRIKEILERMKATRVATKTEHPRIPNEIISREQVTAAIANIDEATFNLGHKLSVQLDQLYAASKWLKTQVSNAEKTSKVRTLFDKSEPINFGAELGHARALIADTEQQIRQISYALQQALRAEPLQNEPAKLSVTPTRLTPPANLSGLVDSDAVNMELLGGSARGPAETARTIVGVTGLPARLPRIPVMTAAQTIRRGDVISPAETRLQHQLDALDRWRSYNYGYLETVQHQVDAELDQQAAILQKRIARLNRITRARQQYVLNKYAGRPTEAIPEQVAQWVISGGMYPFEAEPGARPALPPVVFAPGTQQARLPAPQLSLEQFRTQLGFGRGFLTGLAGPPQRLGLPFYGSNTPTVNQLEFQRVAAVAAFRQWMGQQAALGPRLGLPPPGGLPPGGPPIWGSGPRALNYFGPMLTGSGGGGGGGGGGPPSVPGWPFPPGWGGGGGGGGSAAAAATRQPRPPNMWTGVLQYAGLHMLVTQLYKVQSAISDSTEKAAEFSIKLAEIQTISEAASARGLEPLARDTLRLSKRWAQSPMISAQAVYNAISDQMGALRNIPIDMGVHDDLQTVLDYVNDVAEFSRASVTPLDMASQAVASILNSYQMGPGSASNIAAQMFRTIDVGRVTGQQLSGTIGRVMPLASELSIRPDEVLAGIAHQTIMGIKPEESYTLLANTMLKLIRPTKELKKELLELGVGSVQLGIQGKGFQGFLDYVTKHSGTAAEAVGGLFNQIRASRSVMTLTGDDAKRYQAILAQIRSTTPEILAAAAKKVERVPGMTYRDIKTQFDIFWTAELGPKTLAIFNAVMGTSPRALASTGVALGIGATGLVGASALYQTGSMIKAIITTIRDGFVKIQGPTSGVGAFLTQNKGAVAGGLTAAALAGLGLYAYLDAQRQPKATLGDHERWWQDQQPAFEARRNNIQMQSTLEGVDYQQRLSQGAEALGETLRQLERLYQRDRTAAQEWADATEAVFSRNIQARVAALQGLIGQMQTLAQQAAHKQIALANEIADARNAASDAVFNLSIKNTHPYAQGQAMFYRAQQYMDAAYKTDDEQRRREMAQHAEQLATQGYELTGNEQALNSILRQRVDILREMYSEQERVKAAATAVKVEYERGLDVIERAYAELRDIKLLQENQPVIGDEFAKRAERARALAKVIGDEFTRLSKLKPPTEFGDITDRLNMHKAIASLGELWVDPVTGELGKFETAFDSMTTRIQSMLSRTFDALTNKLVSVREAIEQITETKLDPLSGFTPAQQGLAERIKKTQTTLDQRATYNQQMELARIYNSKYKDMFDSFAQNLFTRETLGRRGGMEPGKLSDLPLELLRQVFPKMSDEQLWGKYGSYGNIKPYGPGGSLMQPRPGYFGYNVPIEDIIRSGTWYKSPSVWKQLEPYLQSKTNRDVMGQLEAFRASTGRAFAAGERGDMPALQFEFEKMKEALLTKYPPTSTFFDKMGPLTGEMEKQLGALTEQIQKMVNLSIETSKQRPTQETLLPGIDKFRSDAQKVNEIISSAFEDIKTQSLEAKAKQAAGSLRALTEQVEALHRAAGKGVQPLDVKPPKELLDKGTDTTKQSPFMFASYTTPDGAIVVPPSLTPSDVEQSPALSKLPAGPYATPWVPPYTGGGGYKTSFSIGTYDPRDSNARVISESYDSSPVASDGSYIMQEFTSSVNNATGSFIELSPAANNVVSSYDAVAQVAYNVVSSYDAITQATYNAAAALDSLSASTRKPAPNYGVGYASGGDVVNARLTPGEFVMTPQATQTWHPMLRVLNAMATPRFARGGDVTNVGDVIVNIHGSADKINGREIAQAVRRALRQNTARLT